MPSWFKRFARSTSAPMVDKQTTFPGCAASSAARSTAQSARASGKPGVGSNKDGSMTKAPSVPANAALSASGSLKSA